MFDFSSSTNKIFIFLSNRGLNLGILLILEKSNLKLFALFLNSSYSSVKKIETSELLLLMSSSLI